MTNFPKGHIIDKVMLASAIILFSTPPISDRSDITCFRCGERSHVKAECLHWKTRICWHFTNGKCTKKNCPFAHGNIELRTPWNLRCVRIVKMDGQFVDMGCGSTMHSYRNCPYGYMSKEANN